MQDLYTILGVSPTASMMEIEGAYQRLYSNLKREKKYGGKDVKNKLFLVKQAYKVLGNHDARCAYDMAWEHESLADPSTFMEERKISRAEIGGAHWGNVWLALKNKKNGNLNWSLWNSSLFQWFFALIVIFIPIFTLFVAKILISNSGWNEEKVEIPFLEKVGILSENPRNQMMTIRELESAWLSIHESPMEQVNGNMQRMLTYIGQSNAAECGLNEQEIHEFFDNWIAAHCIESSRKEIGNFYNAVVFFKGEQLTRESLVFKKNNVFKNQPNYMYCTSATVKFEKLMNDTYAMKFINFAGTQRFSIRAGYLEFILTQQGPKIVNENY